MIQPAIVYAISGVAIAVKEQYREEDGQQALPITQTNANRLTNTDYAYQTPIMLTEHQSPSHTAHNTCNGTDTIADN